MALFQFLKEKNNSEKNDFLSDSYITDLITTVLNEGSKFRHVQIAIWVWNRTDNRFTCSTDFFQLMHTSPQVNVDLDYWAYLLAPDDLIKFADALESVFFDTKIRSFIISLMLPNIGKKTIQCVLESMAYPGNKKYIVGIFCDISKSIFADPMFSEN
jgi:hypothetical protein